MRVVPRLLALVIGVVAGTAQAQSSNSIINSKHNLSASGPGIVRAAGEPQVCIFCHTPHHATNVYPLWNRTILPTAYTPYKSNSLNAKPGQPTGASKLCLSCHDGTIALGSVVTRTTPITMAGGVTTLPPGKSNLGTNLTDDHPISFKYDQTLMGDDPKLKDPLTLPQQVKLDTNNELQCTTCHDAHDNSKGKFLVMDNSNSQLCNSCHDPGKPDATTVVGHKNCGGCHQPHSAPSGPHLLKAAKVADACLPCHDGGTGATHGPNVASSMTKFYRHDTGIGPDQPNHAPLDTTCTDCHGPHTMKTGVALAPDIRPNFGTVPGVSAAGATVAKARYEYEVCFTCHSTASSTPPRVARQVVQTNTRLEFAPSAISFHPVQVPGKNTSVPSLKAGYTTSSMIYCSDCHASSDSKKAGGSAANGTHGSANIGLLVAAYDLDGGSYNMSMYALCYRCHEETRIMSESGPFKYHKKHVQEYRASCAACHDSHGISSEQGTTAKNAHLMNFDTRICTPSSNGKFEYNSTSRRCSMTCHSPNKTVDHRDKGY